MSNNHDMKLWQKIIVGMVILAATLVMPELLYIIDLGGIELVFGFMVIYFKALIAWIELKIEAIKNTIKMIQQVLLNTALSRPKVLSLNAIYCGFVFTLTGSLLFSMSFVFPTLFITAGY